MPTLNERAANLDRRVEITISLPVCVLVSLEGHAHDIGLSREEGFLDAISLWVARREQSINRQDRFMIQKALREAADKQPVEELLERFRKQMGETRPRMMEGPRNISPNPLTADLEPATVPPMPSLTRSEVLRQRREALGLSRERLARLADVSSASIEQFEGGLIPKKSEVLGLVESALRQQERIAV
jgi:DNA-binding XRE family transcriptional regulator